MARIEGKATRAYHQIERMIVFQEIAPGSLISESEMMESTGLGRTPVREALQRLARSRMVEIHPNKGVLVPAISVDGQLKQLQLRRVLEVLAVRLACDQATAMQRQDMRLLLDELEAGGFSLAEYAETIKRTHELIAEGSNNEYLADAIAPVQGLSRRFWIAHVVDEESEIKFGSRLHIRLLRAILDGDPDRAEKVSLELNDYLVRFARATVAGPNGSGPRSGKRG